MLTVMFGRYPAPNEEIADYKAGVRKAFDVPEKVIVANAELPPELLGVITPLALTTYDVTRSRDLAGWLNPGIDE